MRMDFHTHGKLAKHLPFSREYTKWLFGEARLAKLDAICLTEHYNSTELEKFYQFITQTLDRDGDCFLFDKMKIFSGMEIDIAEKGHILMIGAIEDICVIRRELESYFMQGDHPAFAWLLEISKQFPVIIGAGHPFRSGSNIPGLPDIHLKQLDFIDLNGKDLAFDRDTIETQTRALAYRLGLPVVAGSDTHQASQYGCIYNIFQDDITTIGALKRSIAHGRYTIEYSEFAGAQVRTAGTLKRALKKIHALGGDYVSILTDG